MKTFLLQGHLIAESPLATCSADLAEQSRSKNGDNSPIPVPQMPTSRGMRLYFPATGIRSALRRASTKQMVAHEASAKGETTPWSLDQLLLMAQGGKQAQEVPPSSPSDRENWRSKNPHLSLFGAAAAGDLGFLAGNLAVSNAIAKEAGEPTVFSGAQADIIHRGAVPIAWLSDQDKALIASRGNSVRARVEVEKQITLAKKALKAAKGNEAATSSAKANLDDLEAQLAKLKGADSVASLRPLAGYQAIPQGTEMEHSIRLFNSDDRELGALLLALEAFAFDPILGAHRSTGCGVVSGEWEAFEVDPIQMTRQSLGTVTLSPFEGIQVSPALQAKIDAYKAFLAGPDWDFRIPTLKG